MLGGGAEFAGDRVCLIGGLADDIGVAFLRVTCELLPVGVAELQTPVEIIAYATSPRAGLRPGQGWGILMIGSEENLVIRPSTIHIAAMHA